MILSLVCERLTRAALFLLILSTVFLSISCGSPSTTETGHPKLPPGDSGVSNKEPAKINLLSNAVSIQSLAGTAEILQAGMRDLQNGDSITTDATGEAAIEIGTCKTIFIYRESRIKKDSCSKHESRNTYCTLNGTGKFKDCGDNLVTESDSATVVLIGTDASHTYLPDRQLAVVLLFEGTANARPVTETRERTLGPVTTIQTKYFWFSVPDDRLPELRALNIGLNARTAYPFSKLPQLLAKIPELDLVPAAEQAIRDKEIPPEDIKYFRPSGGEHADNGVASDNPGHSVSLPPAQSMAYGLTKVGGKTVKEFSTVNGANLQPDSVRVTSGTPFSHIVATPTANKFFVAFEPKSSGDQTADLTFSDKTGRFYRYKLSGTAAYSGMELSAESLGFTGPNPRLDRLHVKSTGDVPLEINKIMLVQDLDQRFKVTDSCKNALQKGSQCEILIEHNRIAADLSIATKDEAYLLIANDSHPAPKMIKVSASVLPTLNVVEALPFGLVIIPATCSQILTVKNNSDKEVQVSAATITGPKTDAFSVAENTCTNAKLKPSVKTECNVKVKFEPWTSTDEFAQIVLSYKGVSGSEIRSVKLSGKGQEPLFKFLAQGNFGTVQIGAKETLKTIPIERLRQPVTKVERVELAGPAQDDYHIRNETCTKSTTERCEVTVAFEPKAEGLRSAELVLVGAAEPQPPFPVTGTAVNIIPVSLKRETNTNDNRCAREFRVEIDGKAYAAWEIREKGEMCFGGKSVVKGKDTKPRIVELHFTSQTKETLSPRIYHVSGDRDDFEILSKKCDDATKSCTVNILFKPQATMKRKAILSIAPDGNTPPAEVELYGKGKSSNPFKRFGRWIVGLFTDEAARSCRR